jgi:hypoxanthine phosphoribosyltransferase
MDDYPAEAFTWERIQRDSCTLAERIYQSKFSVDNILAVGRGGWIPGVIMSHYLKCGIYPCRVSSYTEDNEQGQIDPARCQFPQWDLIQGDNLLIVDDLSDSGKTFNFLEYHLRVEMRAGLINKKRIKTAALYMKWGTLNVPDFYVQSFERERWLIFPWEVHP